MKTNNLQVINADAAFQKQQRFSFFQPKLAINDPNDKFEQEADAVANKVMQMETPPVQTKAAGNLFFNVSPTHTIPVQRKCAHCEEEEKKVQRKEINGKETTADNSLESYVGNLNGGRSLPNEVRNFYEPRFGYDFTNVKVHTDTIAAKSAQSINALAYTSGDNIVFNENQYSPGTDSGKKLLGHELTHVVQQQSAGPMLQRKQPEESKEEKCMHQKINDAEDLLPAGVGVLTHIDRSLMLEEMFGTELPAITAKIIADNNARKFICSYGISGMAALVNTQKKDGSFDVAAAQAAVDASGKNKNGPYSRNAMEAWRIADKRKKDIGEEAGSIGAWAKDEDRKDDTIPSPSAALNMPAVHVAEISQMIANLELLNTHFNSAGTLFSDADKKRKALFQIFKNLVPSTIFPESFGSDVGKAMDTATSTADDLSKLVFSIGAGRLNTTTLDSAIMEVKNNSATIKSMAMDQLRKVLANQTPDFSDLKDQVRATNSGPVKRMNDEFTAIKTTFDKNSTEIPKLLFVLKYFRALNDAGSKPPDETEMKNFVGLLDSIDTSLFFGSGPVNPGLEIMGSAISFIKKQVQVRLQIKNATGNLPALIPKLDEVQAFFTTMHDKKITNEVVRKAYDDFAAAYFQHRGEVSLQDMTVNGISDVFAMPVSILGTRSIVCAGYAQMGAALMHLAGATSISFTVAVRATDEQIKNNAIDEGHAIVKVTRNAGTFFISNDSTFDTEKEAMDVMWDHPDFPLHKASAVVYNDAVRALEVQLSRIR